MWFHLHGVQLFMEGEMVEGPYKQAPNYDIHSQKVEPARRGKWPRIGGTHLPAVDTLSFKPKSSV